MRTCSKCGVEKDESRFNKEKLGPGGLRSDCKDCVSARRKKNYLARQEYFCKKSKDYRESNPDKHKQAKRRAVLKGLYGITPEVFDRMLAEQAGCCKICDQVMPKPNVDHCHITGKVRALLCRECNCALGGFKDSPKLCIRASEYLKNFSCPSLDE